MRPEEIERLMSAMDQPKLAHEPDEDREPPTPRAKGRLKVMASLTNWFREFRKYHRDDKGSGKIVKRDDHLMDATRYLIISGRHRMHTQPQPPRSAPRPPRGGAMWL